MILTEAPKKKGGKYAPVPFGQEEHEKKFVLDYGKKVVSFLKKNCKPWLQQTDNGRYFVYRGFARGRESNHAVFTKVVRPNRKPRNTENRHHKLLDQMIGHCGKVANRSNSSFATGSSNIPSVYGKVYIVVPVSKFNYTWHTQYTDWYGYADKLLIIGPTKLDKQTRKEIVDKAKVKYKKMGARIERLHKFLVDQKLDISYEDLLDALRRNALWEHFRIMATAKSGMLGDYYIKKLRHDAKTGVPSAVVLFKIVKVYKKLSPTLQEKMDKLLNMALADRFKVSSEKAFIDSAVTAKLMQLRDQAEKKNQLNIEEIEKRICPKIKGDDGTLIDAIKSKKEIMIKSDSIIAISPTLYEAVILPMLQGKKPAENTDYSGLLYEISGQEE